ncbi:MAG: polysulfide reductase NrfD [Planctomycetaceae bacterium]|jgi:Ni/Fe-hydrogenase subunit HybB-like protein|nr:polysulfide reductase NrfD [Planctomycetaceae bacterium]
MDFNIEFKKWFIRISYDHWSFRITPLRFFLILLSLLTAVVLVYRFAFGLQSVSNLNDQWPWGLWKGWAVFAGAALAGGGYGTTFLVHILHIERLKLISHRTLLISLLGYTLMLVGLFTEIGRWFNFWRPYISWGHESALFEVFWCVSLYFIIQVLELGEIVTEKVFRQIHWFFVRFFPVFAVIGVMLPTLHQSSLGAIYLMTDGRLHPLWWSPLIFLFFLLSSLFVGPAMLVMESVLVGFAFGHKTPNDVLKILARIGGGMMILYLALKIGDLVVHNETGLLFEGSFESYAFIAEHLFGIVIPILIVFSPLINYRGWIITYGFLTSVGVFANRMNVVITGMIRDAGVIYYPTLCEVIISFGLVSTVLLIYLFLCENFNILLKNNDSCNPNTADGKPHGIAEK